MNEIPITKVQTRLTYNGAHATFESVAKSYGAKAAGLFELPPKWCPPFIAVAARCHEAWLLNRGQALSAARQPIEEWLALHSSTSTFGFILRSSGTSETIRDRGLLRSVPLPANAQFDAVQLGADEIFNHARLQGFSGHVGLVLQLLVAKVFEGHLSNETEVSPTRNQWKYEVSGAGQPTTKGLNSKTAEPPAEDQPIFSAPNVFHGALRSVANWLEEKVAPRCHIEWLCDDRNLWIVQLDSEWREEDSGVDPSLSLELINQVLSLPDKSTIFDKYLPQQNSRFKKLRNLSEFDFISENHAPPKLFYLTGDRLKVFLEDTGKVASEIDALTGGRAVIRCDVDDNNSKQFNLPRTDTVTGGEAVAWLLGKIGDFESHAIQLKDVCFILHTFIPAASAAWAHAQPNSPLVKIDCLWGMPDGLQFLAHDSFEFDAIRKKTVSEEIRYKPKFLQEQRDGKWTYVDIARAAARKRCITSKDLSEIASRTHAIAQSVGEPVQLMWFSGIPELHGVGRNLPWFRARQFAETVAGTSLRYPPYEITTPDDLGRLPDGLYTLRIVPAPEFIRSEDFLESILSVAKARRLPVQLPGSRLAHAYYQLSRSGVALIQADDRRYSRVRGRRIFGKIVRDGIPSEIRSGGEIVREAVLVREDWPNGLIAKLFEESLELKRAETKSEVLEELSDLAEVLDGLIAANGFTVSEVDEKKLAKRQLRGGFFERKILLETSLPQDGGEREVLKQVRLSELSPAMAHDQVLSIPFSCLLASSDLTSFAIHVDSLKTIVEVSLIKGSVRISISETPIQDSLKEEQLEFPLLAAD